MTAATPACSIGIDFGTVSCRAVVVAMATGRQLATAVADFPHGVIDRQLPLGRVALGADWALQHPGDYLSSMSAIEAAAAKVDSRSSALPDSIFDRSRISSISNSKCRPLSWIRSEYWM